MILRWFRGKQIALAFALTLTMARLGFAGVLQYRSQHRRALLAACAALWRRPASARCRRCAMSFRVLRSAAAAGTGAAPTIGRRGHPTALTARLASLFSFGRPYYFLVAFCVTFYAAFFPFTALAPDSLGEKWQISATNAGRLCSPLTLLTVVLSPLFGDFRSRRPQAGRSDLLPLLCAAPVDSCLPALGDSCRRSSPPASGNGVLMAPAALWPQLGSRA